MFKKLLSVCLALIMVAGTGSSAFAASTNGNDRAIVNNKVVTNQDIVYVDDGEGNIVPVTIIESIYVSINDAITPRSFSPTSKVGEKRYYEVKISNQALGAPSAGAGAVTLTAAMRKKATKAAAAAITKKIGSKFIPGLGVATTISGLVSWGNGQLGNNGFKFSIGLEYVGTYIHKEGHYIYGWGIKSASVRTY